MMRIKHIYGIYIVPFENKMWVVSFNNIDSNKYKFEKNTLRKLEVQIFCLFLKYLQFFDNLGGFYLFFL